MYGNGRTALADALDIATAELELLIDRHFAAHRELVVEAEGSNWTAAIGDVVLFRSADRRAVLRFARTFADRTPRVSMVVLAEPWTDPDGFSVRVDNVVPLHAS